MDTITASLQFSTVHYIGGLSLGLFVWLSGWIAGKCTTFIKSIMS